MALKSISDFIAKGWSSAPFPLFFNIEKNEAIDFLSVSHSARNIKMDSKISYMAVSRFRGRVDVELQ